MKKNVLLLAMKIALALLVLTLSIVLSGQPSQANLLVNGSFENTENTFIANSDDTMKLAAGSTAIPGWEVINNEIAWIGPSNTFNLSASDGSYFLDLTSYNDNSSLLGGVEQTITLSPGQYRLKFDLGSSQQYGTTVKITSTAGATTATFTSTNTSSNNVWEPFAMNFSASGLTTISLTGTDGQKYIGLDNVDVSAIPLPASAWLLGSGLVGLWFMRRRWTLKK